MKLSQRLNVPDNSKLLEDLLGLDDLKNLWGPLKPEIRKRLLAVLKNPTQATWSNAYSIILRNDTGRVSTLWQFWILIDTTAPRVGPSYDDSMKLGRWARIPSQEELFWILRAAATMEAKAAVSRG